MFLVVLSLRRFTNVNERKGIMQYNFGMLRELIKREYGTLGRFAEAMGVPKQRISMLLTNKATWNSILIYRAVELLGIPTERIGHYFFTTEV